MLTGVFGIQIAQVAFYAACSNLKPSEALLSLLHIFAYAGDICPHSSQMLKNPVFDVFHDFSLRLTLVFSYRNPPTEHT